MKLVEKYKFPSLFINQFYPRPGTPAAKMHQVPAQIVSVGGLPFVFLSQIILYQIVIYSIVGTRINFARLKFMGSFMLKEIENIQVLALSPSVQIFAEIALDTLSNWNAYNGLINMESE